MPRNSPQFAEIWFLPDQKDTKGIEVKGDRFCLVITVPSRLHNSETVMVALITKGGNKARDKNLTVSMDGLPQSTQGVVLCNAVRSLDLVNSGAIFVEQIKPELVEAVWQKIDKLAKR